MSGYFSDLLYGARSLLAGFGVTLRALLSPAVTVQYPREKTPPPKGYRGHVKLRTDAQGAFTCVACGTCSRMCPAGCIEVAGEKREGRPGRYPTRFMLDFTRCSLCGTCVEACPVGALAFSNVYAQAGTTREEFVIDLVCCDGDTA